MWPFDGSARNQLGQSHTMCARVDVLHSGRVVFTLVPTAGSVTAQAGRTVMRNLTGTFADPTGSLSGGDITDLLSPYECELAIYRGVLVPVAQATVVDAVPTAGLGLQPLGASAVGGVELVTATVWSYEQVWAPLGVFKPTSRDAAGDGQVTVTGQDRAIVYQGPMTGALAISGGTPIEDAIARLLTTRNPGVHMQSWATGFTCGPLLYAPDIDVWAEAQKLAQSVGGWIYHDRTGELVFGSLLPTSTLPVARWAEGDGLLISADRQEDSDTIHNVVVVQNADKTITAVAEDDDPTSPTYSRGSYGYRVAPVIVNEHIGSLQQAQQAAYTELARELGRSETAKVTIVPDPTLDPLDAGTVHRPRIGLVERALIADSLEVPLTATDAMTVSFRKYILTRDGSTLTTDMETVS